jgi:iron complex outermembrane recepter protein
MREWKAVLIISIISIFFTSLLYAADETADQDKSSVNGFTLGEIVVTGKKETITKVATVETIDESRMMLTNVDNVSDALDTLPGVIMSVGQRNEKVFTLRGFNQTYVPVLFDGIPLYVPYDGYVDSGNLPTGNISKISVSKGVSSVLYGPNTMGGVINIISKKPESKFEGDYKLSITDNKDKILNVNLGSMLNKYYFTANVNWLDTDGFYLSKDFQPTDNEDGDKRDNSDNKQWGASFKAGFIPSDAHEYALGVNKVSSEKGLPVSTEERARYWRFTEWEKETYYLLGDSSFNDKLSTKARLYYDTYYNVLDSYDDDTYSTQDMRSSFRSTYDDYSYGGSLVVRSEHLDKNTLSLGINYKDDIHEAQGDIGDEWERYEARTYSWGLEDDIKVNNKLSAVLGVSYDVQKAVDANGGSLRDDISSFNPQFGADYIIDDSTGMHFSAGAKTRFPNLKELYSERMGDYLPNPDLKAEKAINYELGFEKALGGLTDMEFNLFYSDIKNKIVTVAIDEDFDQNQNIGKAVYKGFEFVTRTGFIANNQIELSYTYLDAKDRSADRTSDFLEDVPEHKLYLSDNYQINDVFSIFGKLELNSDRYDNTRSGWVTLDGFWKADAKVVARLFKKSSLEFGINNLLDKNYQLSYGYPREGRSFFLALNGGF